MFFTEVKLRKSSSYRTHTHVCLRGGLHVFVDCTHGKGRLSDVSIYPHTARTCVSRTHMQMTQKILPVWTRPKGRSVTNWREGGGPVKNSSHAHPQWWTTIICQRGEDQRDKTFMKKSSFCLSAARKTFRIKISPCLLRRGLVHWPMRTTMPRRACRISGGRREARWGPVSAGKGRKVLILSAISASGQCCVFQCMTYAYDTDICVAQHFRVSKIYHIWMLIMNLVRFSIKLLQFWWRQKKKQNLSKDLNMRADF